MLTSQLGFRSCSMNTVRRNGKLTSGAILVGSSPTLITIFFFFLYLLLRDRLQPTLDTILIDGSEKLPLS